MGRNAAFGQPPAQDRLRQWLQATSRTARINALLTVGVLAVVLVLMTVATSRDPSRSLPLANATRPNLTPGVAGSATSTPLVGSLFTASAPVDNPVDLFGLSATTTTTIAVAPTVPGPSTRAAAPSSTTAARAPATTVPTSDVIFTAVPTTTLTTGAPATSTPATVPPVTAPPVTTSVPPMPTTPTTAPPATTPPTTAPGIPLPLPLPPLLKPG